MLNTQIPLKSVRSDGLSLSVHSVFYTLQGEGPFSGHPAVFLRLAGCNLQCPGCDTEYTQGAQAMDFRELRRWVDREASKPIGPTPCPLVVITGGEPFRQNLLPLLQELQDAGYTVQIETNGTLPPCDLEQLFHPVTVVCSPKTGTVNPKLQQYISAYKYVAGFDDLMEDGLPAQALDHTARPHLARPHEGYDGPVYLQPMDAHDAATNKLNQDAVVASCLNYGYILCLQTHKIVEVE